MVPLASVWSSLDEDHVCCASSEECRSRRGARQSLCTASRQPLPTWTEPESVPPVFTTDRIQYKPAALERALSWVRSASSKLSRKRMANSFPTRPETRRPRGPLPHPAVAPPGIQTSKLTANCLDACSSSAALVSHPPKRRSRVGQSGRSGR